MINSLTARSRVNEQRFRCWRSRLIADFDIRGLLLLDIFKSLIMYRLVNSVGRTGRSCWCRIGLFYFVNTLNVIIAPFVR